ncbi:relaxase/mobilization nuclease domain-containing protein [Sunxiuqinia elliptica]|uniref:Relaxase/mobilization nuclease-like protein n=1 Tax=Sunxiuqinia elliptica TaxID=655355 RepID=A0A4R6HBP6_9BACT|nr:relaxase/mobilization nuclease domain-containing protein [Sunxiuqinia elliptica]TDO05388.1 relaxase/mobilization nuclease-like protein [Sunxiuqinia elliptica]TDO64935.1 relaxase/mobilization nuclease-like protein [Sunxiuqinia elliptica]
MVIKIHQACSTKNALFYNERKVERHKASFYHSQNMPVVNPFLGDKNDRYRIFKEIEERNTRVRKPGLHLSVNPTVGDFVRLGDAGIRTEINNLMNHLGYGNQPYFVYKHADLERVHFHIVSTRIDCDTGKKIKDSYEKEKTQRFIKGLEEKYQLSKDDPQEKLNYRFSGSSKNLKQNLESIFTQLNRMEFISSKETYDQALGLFQVEIRKAGRGHLVFVTDENGSPIRHPVRMSDFEERPRFYQVARLKENLQDNDFEKRISSDMEKGSRGLKSLVVTELLLQVAKHQSGQKGKITGKKMKSKRRKGKRC